MENPPQNLRYGVNLQRFRMRVRSVGLNATLQLDLYDGPTFVSRLVDTAVDSAGEVIESRWAAESLIERTGRSVEVLVTATGVEIASFVWYPEMILASAGARTVLVPTLIRTEKRTEKRITTVPSSGARERTVNIPSRRL